MWAWRAACVCWPAYNWRVTGCVVCWWVAVSFVIVLFAGDGRVFTWGCNNVGQLGLGDTEKRLTPTAVSLPDDEAVEELHCGMYYFFARVGECVCMFVCVACLTCVCGGSASGAWFAWGHNDDGKLALGDTEDRTVPTRVESVSSLGVASLSCGAGHVLALTSACVCVWIASSLTVVQLRGMCMRGARTWMASLASDTPRTPPPLNSSQRLLARALCGS